jgi:hypothetical protein
VISVDTDAVSATNPKAEIIYNKTKFSFGYGALHKQACSYPPISPHEIEI